MKYFASWLRRVRGALGIGLIWGAVWAGVGALSTVLFDPDGSTGVPWVGPPVGFFPGFVGGLIFSAMLAIAAAPRQLHELSVSRVAAWGAMVGFLLGFLPLAINKPPEGVPVWLVAAVVIGSLTLMGAVSAAGSLALARKAKRRAVLDARVSRH